MRYLSSVVPENGTQEDALCALRYAVDGRGIQNDWFKSKPILKGSGLLFFHLGFTFCYLHHALCSLLYAFFMARF